jgi:hypothetical protein
MMKCQKCKGRVFVDRVFSQKLHVELFCIMCGKRWMINKDRSPLGRWLEQKEFEHLKDYSIFS